MTRVFTVKELEDRALVVGLCEHAEFGAAPCGRCKAEEAMLKQAARQARVLEGLKATVTQWRDGARENGDVEAQRDNESTAQWLHGRSSGYNKVLAELDRLMAEETR